MEQQKAITSWQAGVTLIELMVSLVIIAILASIAIPQYSDYVKRSRIPQAVNNLSNLRVKMEQYYQDNRTYPASCDTAGGMPMPTSDDFAYTCTVLNANAFTVQAQGTGSMTGFTYTIDQANAMMTTAIPAAWGSLPNGGKTCWVRRKGPTC